MPLCIQCGARKCEDMASNHSRCEQLFSHAALADERIQTALATISAPLQNAARQRRNLHSLSFTWYERAVYALEISGDPPFVYAATSCQAIRLDCLLDAALLGFQLDLFSMTQEAENWWWTNYICTSRLAQFGYAEDWRKSWASLWLAISDGMGAVSTGPCSMSDKQLCATTSILHSLPRAQFNVRHKWDRKIPKRNRSGARCAPYASYRVWSRYTQELKDTETVSRVEGEGRLTKLQGQLRRRAHESFSDALSVLKELETAWLPKHSNRDMEVSGVDWRHQLISSGHHQTT